MFGNVALTAGTGALALGFWSNKNGQAIFNAGTGSLTINGTTYTNITDLQLTDVLNLVQADARTGLNGVQWDPASYAAFRSWLLSATAKDMAYMLSAQLVTTELDVFNNYVKAGAYIDVAAVSGVSLSILTTGVTINGTTYALAVDSAGFASIQSIMDAANAVLGAGSTADNTVSGSAERASVRNRFTIAETVPDTRRSALTLGALLLSASAPCCRRPARCVCAFRAQ